MFLQIPQNPQWNTCARDSFLIKLYAKAWKFIKKESLAQVLSCEFREISKNSFFYITPSVAASAKSKNTLSLINFGQQIHVGMDET